MVENALWKILALIISVLLLFIIPLQNMFQRQDDISYTIVYTESNKFIDTARDIGYFNEEMYLNFINKLKSTGNIYNITLEHYYKRYIPIYDSTDTIYLNKYTISYEGIYTDDILEDLKNEGIYKMKSGDLIYINVTNTSKTKASKLRDIIYNNSLKHPSIYVRGGGMVKDEAY